MNDRKAGHFIRSSTSRGAHIRALHAALLELIELCPPEPCEKRVRLRDHTAALVRTYPHLKLSDVDVAQLNAEEDGWQHED